MFNLCIYTHRPSKSIYIEPYDDFFSGDIIDWRDRQRGENRCYKECAVDSFMATELGYQPSDGAVGYRYDTSNGEFGTWRFDVRSYATKQSIQRHKNPLFHPTATYASFIGTAPSAELLTVGNRDIVTQDGSLEPRIVLYHGIEPLPSGEYWPSPNGHTGYPLATFHSPEHNATLCFNDRDGCTGLHHYYDTELNERATRQRLECDIHITPIEYASLFVPNHSGATIRSNFRLKAGGQSSLFRLESIESYDTTNNIAHCVFVRRLTD
jgi:hypothetical protein